MAKGDHGGRGTPPSSNTKREPDLYSRKSMHGSGPSPTARCSSPNPTRMSRQQRNQSSLSERRWLRVHAARHRALAATILPRANHRVNDMHEDLAVRPVQSAMSRSQTKSGANIYIRAERTNQRSRGASPNARRGKSRIVAWLKVSTPRMYPGIG
jgi:hypothetical protein